MTPRVLDPPVTRGKLGWGGETFASSPADGQDATIGSVLSHHWEGLWSGLATECPLCGHSMHLRNGAGHCTGCGTVLS